MKKIIFACVAVLTSLGMVACDNNESATTLETEEDNTRVVDRDSVATEYEVTETVVEYDTTTRTKTVDADVEEIEE